MPRTQEAKSAIGVLLNPNSRKNRQRPHRREKLQGIVGDYGIVRQTRDVEEIPPVLDEFIQREIPYWVSDGGDGALHWMINKGMALSYPESIPGGQALPPGGRVDHRRDDQRRLGGVRLGQARLEAGLADLAGRLSLELAHLGSGEVRGVRIEAGEDPLDGPLDHRLELAKRDEGMK